MRRLHPAPLAFAILLLAAPGVQAQLGDIVKKKAVKAATGKPTDTVAVKGAAVKCDASSTVISSDVIGRYIKSWTAYDAMMEKLAKEPGPTGAYYAAFLKRRAIEDRKAEYDLHRGPDWQRAQAISKRMMAGEQAAFREGSELSESLNPSSVQVPTPEWEAQQKNNARIDSTMKAAGGFSDCDWLDLGERMPRIVYILVDNEATTDFQGYATAKEGVVLRSRFPELARAMHVRYVTAADKARLKAEQDSLNKTIPSTGNAQQDCINKSQSDWAKAHQDELDKAKKAEDNAALVRMSLEMAKAALHCVQE